MLPDSYDSPALSSKPSKVAAVPLARLGYLLSPKRRELVLPCWKAVSVPEVTVNEYGDLFPRKDNIRLARESLHMLPEPKPSLVKLRPDAYLHARVLPLDAGHAVAALLRRQVIGHLATMIAQQEWAL